MISLVFCAVLVGLPAYVGALLIARPGGKHDVATGAGLLVYATILAGVFAVLFPDGRLTTTNYALKMPGAVIGGALIGAVVGWLNRNR